MRAPARAPRLRASIGTALVLMATGGALAFGVNAPARITRYVDLLDLGLILVWAGILILVMHVVMTRPPQRRRPSRRPAYDDPHRDSLGGTAYTQYADDRDVHRPGYAGQTQRLPIIRDRNR